MGVQIKHLDFPWRIVVDIPSGISHTEFQHKRTWRREIRDWMKDNGIEFLWEEMNTETVIFRVKTETDALLIKMQYS